MSDPRHWLYRPDNWPKLWKWGGALLFLSVVAEFLLKCTQVSGLPNRISSTAASPFILFFFPVILTNYRHLLRSPDPEAMT